MSLVMVYDSFGTRPLYHPPEVKLKVRRIQFMGVHREPSLVTFLEYGRIELSCRSVVEVNLCLKHRIKSGICILEVSGVSPFRAVVRVFVG